MRTDRHAGISVYPHGCKDAYINMYSSRMEFESAIVMQTKRRKMKKKVAFTFVLSIWDVRMRKITAFES